ncbi:protein kinase, partial [bacterium]|nr:protein kinase [bacterium]
MRPENVLFLPGAAVKLADFGIALSDDVSVRLTGQDEVLGSAQYMAPEVAASSSWTPAADVYALGALAFRSLAGRALFDEELDAAKILKAQVEKRPETLSGIAPEVPQALSDLVARLLSKKPEERPKASELVSALREIAPAAAGPRTAPATLARDIGRLALRRGHGAGEARLSPGRSLHCYRIEAELGRGGMGVVYRAFHTGLKRIVALKVLLSGALATDEAKRRFHREAEAAGALRHPNIVSVLDVGEHDGRHYLTMEFIEGIPLSKHLRTPTESLRSLLVLFAHICDAVHHAHTRGVIHRDLKPDNVLVDASGEPHILDFGIAKRIDGTTQNLTAEGNVLGTLRYMPPEQAGGRIHEVDVRSDVYALGSILYEVVTRGETPFDGTMREILQQIHFDVPRPPSFHR